MPNRGTKGLYLVGRLALKNGTTFLDGAGAPTNGTGGTGHGTAPKGSFYVDVTNAVVYLNSNTKASPTWTQITLGGTGTPLVAKVALAAVDTAGGIFAWQAPAAAFVHKVVVDVTTIATGACTLDIGYTTVSATTLSDTIIDGVDVHSATGTFDNVLNAGTNGAIGGAANTLLQEMKVASGKWITGSMASGASAGLVGFVYIFYTLV